MKKTLLSFSVRRGNFLLFLLAAVATASAEERVRQEVPAQRITESLVASPQSAADADWFPVKTAGGDFHLALSPEWRKLKGVSEEEFVKKACQVAQIDLTPFFERYGFLKPLRIEVNDYGKEWFEITEEEVKQLRKEIRDMKLPKLKVPFWYITDETVDLFRTSQSLQAGTAQCKGNTFTMDGWKGAVAYEVFQGKKRIFVSPLSHFTVEGLQVNADMKVYAIGSNGKRKKVDFQWTEDAEQWKKMQARDSKFKNMYNR